MRSPAGPLAGGPLCRWGGLRLGGEFFVLGQQAPELLEDAHDGDVDADGAFAVEDRGKHGHAQLGEHAGYIPAPAPLEPLTNVYNHNILIKDGQHGPLQMCRL